jgi:hypothetical protein
LPPFEQLQRHKFDRLGKSAHADTGKGAFVGERIVESVREFQAFTDECLDWAKTAKSDRERGIFLQMAETWIRAAILAESAQPSSGPSQFLVAAEQSPRRARQQKGNDRDSHPVPKLLSEPHGSVA